MNKESRKNVRMQVPWEMEISVKPGRFLLAVRLSEPRPWSFLRPRGSVWKLTVASQRPRE